MASVFPSSGRRRLSATGSQQPPRALTHGEPVGVYDGSARLQTASTRPVPLSRAHAMAHVLPLPEETVTRSSHSPASMDRSHNDRHGYRS